LRRVESENVAIILLGSSEVPKLNWVEVGEAGGHEEVAKLCRVTSSWSFVNSDA